MCGTINMCKQHHHLLQYLAFIKLGGDGKSEKAKFGPESWALQQTCKTVSDDTFLFDTFRMGVDWWRAIEWLVRN